MMHERRAGVFALAAGLFFPACATHLVLAGTLPNVAGTLVPSTNERVRTASPTPEPTPTPPRLNVKVDLENRDSPIYIYGARLRNGSAGRTYSQCVSFRNVSNKVATDVDFSFVVKAHSGKVWADFGHVERGRFAPPVNIEDHCWKGPLWPDPVVRSMSRETVRIKQVTFADATTWQPGLHFTRKYADGGTPVEMP